MLNRLFEKGMVIRFLKKFSFRFFDYDDEILIHLILKPKCEMYYPNLDEDNSETTIELGKFRLNYLSETPSKDYSIRTIECENLQVNTKLFI